MGPNLDQFTEQGRAMRLDAIPHLSMENFSAHVRDHVAGGKTLVALCGSLQDDGAVRLYAVLADRVRGRLGVATTEVHDRYPALTPSCPAASSFEREIAEQWGVEPSGHPWSKPLRFQRSLRPGHDLWPGRGGAGALPGVVEHFQVEGEEIHEVAVGPIHAGIIEPGHFRFQCHGEQVLNLEITLGYQHRGVERALAGGPDKRTIHYVETLAGDTTIGHALAYAQALETLAGCEIPPRARALRGIALELERLANHCGDLGAMAQDVGFLPTASYCGRVRGDFLNMTAALCGSRFGRGLVRPGGVAFDVDAGLVTQLLACLDAAMRDAAGAARLLWETSSVRSRFENTGTLSRDSCVQLGIVGPVARASGLAVDARRDLPSGAYRDAAFPVSTCTEGDVYARAFVRWLEMQTAADFVRQQLQGLAGGPVRSPLGRLAPLALAASCVEGWRGEIHHVAITGADGALARYKVVDPSFRNWPGLALALREQQIADFPLCNKSFNLSYCGHDL